MGIREDFPEREAEICKTRGQGKEREGQALEHFMGRACRSKARVEGKPPLSGKLQAGQCSWSTGNRGRPRPSRGFQCGPYNAVSVRVLQTVEHSILL